MIKDFGAAQKMGQGENLVQVFVGRVGRGNKDSQFSDKFALIFIFLSFLINMDNHKHGKNNLHNTSN